MQFQYIEYLVQRKKRLKAKHEIHKLLRQDSSEEVVFLAAQWYRRLSFYVEGLRLAMRLNPFDPGANHKVKLLTADCLSHLGASFYALQIVENNSPQTADELEILGGIYFAADDYSNALKNFQQRISLAKEPTDYNIRLSELSCADCLANLGRISEAISLCQKLMRISHETLFLSICRQALGEYYALAGKTKLALRWLLESKKSMPGKSFTFDHALLFRWLGFVYFKLGKKKIGRQYFEKSLKIIRKTQLGDEVWVKNFRLLKTLNGLNTSESARIDFFPGPQNSREEFFRPLNLLAKQNRIKVYVTSNEFVVDEKHFLGIPLEIRMLCQLRIAESWGVKLETLKISLWPNEGRSYLQLEMRLRQMIVRIKHNYGISCKVRDKRIYLRKKDYKTLGVLIDQQTLPRKINKSQLFTRKEFQTQYNLEKAQANRWLKKFVAEGLLEARGEGKNIRYMVASSAEKETS